MRVKKNSADQTDFCSENQQMKSENKMYKWVRVFVSVQHWIQN